jgi:large subunit ribosomal protein L30e
MIDIGKAIAAAVKTGKVVFGAEEGIRSARAGKARAIILTSNIQPHMRENLEYFGQLSKIPIIAFKGSSIDLGRTCGKRFTVSTLTIKEPGDSNILDLVQEPEE